MRPRRVSKRYKDITPLVEASAATAPGSPTPTRTRSCSTPPTGDERELWRDEFDEAEADVDRLEDEIRALMLPKDPNDGRAVIMEIRGAEGGEEANLFARDLFDMYQAYAARKGWKFEVLSSDPSDLGGVNQVDRASSAATRRGAA